MRLLGLEIGAQQQVVGHARQAGDAAVPGAQVELKNIATGAMVTTTTGAEGLFRFNSLVPATYNLTIKPAAGFKTYTQPNIEVTAGSLGSSVNSVYHFAGYHGAFAGPYGTTVRYAVVPTPGGMVNKEIRVTEHGKETVRQDYVLLDYHVER